MYFDPGGKTMKRTMLSILLLFALTMAACGNTGSGSETDSTQATDLSIEMKLVVGTLKLEGTDQAVTGEQAGELLVMWQVYQELSSSDTAAQAEIDGLVEQIRETMTTEQMKAITAMNLTQQDVFALIQEQGAGMASSQRSGSDNTFTFSPAAGGGPPDGGGGAPPDGGMAGGVPPDGGMGGDIGGVSSAGSGSGANQSQQSSDSTGAGGSTGVPTALVGTLIQYLEGIAGS
jgi:hypothetical protein